MKKKNRLNKNFEKWIKSHGDRIIAELLDVSEPTVRHWRLGNVLPRSSQMKKIKTLTKGQVSYENIIEGSISPLMR